MHGELGNKLVQHAKRTQTLPALPPYQTELVRAIVREVRDLDRDVTRILEPFATVDAETGASQSTFNPAEHPATACALLVDHLSMRRNKRCLLAYHRVRAERLEAMAWEGRDLLDELHNAHNTIPEESLQQQQQQQYHQGQPNQNQGSHHQHQQNQNQHNQHRPQHPPSAAASAATAGGAHDSLSPEEESYFRRYVDLLAQYKGQWTDIDLTGPLEPPRDLFIDVRVLKDAGEIQTEYGAINLTKNSQFYVRHGDVERLIQMGFLQRLT